MISYTSLSIRWWWCGSSSESYSRSRCDCLDLTVQWLGSNRRCWDNIIRLWLFQYKVCWLDVTSALFNVTKILVELISIFMKMFYVIFRNENAWWSNGWYLKFRFYLLAKHRLPKFRTYAHYVMAPAQDKRNVEKFFFLTTVWYCEGWWNQTTMFFVFHYFLSTCFLCKFDAISTNYRFSLQTINLGWRSLPGSSIFHMYPLSQPFPLSLYF